MASVLNKISPTNAVSSASLEAAIAEHTELLDQHLSEVQVAHGEIKDQVDEIIRGDQTVDAISNLTEGMIQSAGEEGLDEKTAKAYSDSMEALLAAAGIHIPVETLIPSFESGADFSLEAEEKKENVLTRIFKWLAEAFRKFVEMVRGFFSRIWTTIPALRKLNTSLKAKVSKLTGAPKKGDDIQLGGRIQYLVNDEGIVLKPADITSAVMAEYQKFLTQWSAQWAGFEQLEVPSPSSVKLQDFALSVNMIMNKFVAPAQGFKFLPTHAITLKAGSNKDLPTLGMTAKVSKTTIAVKSGAVLPTPSELRRATENVDGALDVLVKLKERTDKITKDADVNAKKLENFKIVPITDNADVKKLADEINKQLPAYRAGLVLMAKGYIDTAPHYLQTIRTIIKYVALSAKRYESGSEEVKELDKDDGKVADGGKVYDNDVDQDKK